MSKLYKIWCEYDMGFNLEGNTGVYTSEESRLKALEMADWECAEASSWQEMEEDGLLELSTVETEDEGE